MLQCSTWKTSIRVPVQDHTLGGISITHCIAVIALLLFAERGHYGHVRVIPEVFASEYVKVPI